jgi:hypothetical protein
MLHAIIARSYAFDRPCDVQVPSSLVDAANLLQAALGSGITHYLAHVMREHTIDSEGNVTPSNIITPPQTSFLIGLVSPFSWQDRAETTCVQSCASSLAATAHAHPTGSR